LLYDGLVLHEPGLTLPHPRMCERVFVLQPMSEIAPDQPIPGKGIVADCLADLSVAKLRLLPRNDLTVHGPTPLPAHAGLARP